MIDTADITGIVLAGGRGSRMGGLDKGLQTHRGAPMALQAMLRLSMQVGPVMINANRNLAAYESFGAPVWPDANPDFAGPLSGFLVGLEQAETPWLMTVPCDSPNFPTDLVARLAEACVANQSDIAIAAAMEDGVLRTQPVFCLMRTTVMESLSMYMHSGGKKIDAWTKTLPHSIVTFPDAQAFFNANTLQELQQLQ
jgi:molybdenum cofactor guanylyltransferase